MSPSLFAASLAHEPDRREQWQPRRRPNPQNSPKPIQVRGGLLFFAFFCLFFDCHVSLILFCSWPLHHTSNELARRARAGAPGALSLPSALASTGAFRNPFPASCRLSPLHSRVIPTPSPLVRMPPRRRSTRQKTSPKKAQPATAAKAANAKSPRKTNTQPDKQPIEGGQGGAKSPSKTHAMSGDEAELGSFAAILFYLYLDSCEVEDDRLPEYSEEEEGNWPDPVRRFLDSRRRQGPREKQLLQVRGGGESRRAHPPPRPTSGRTANSIFE